MLTDWVLRGCCLTCSDGLTWLGGKWSGQMRMTKKTVLWALCFAMLAWQCKAVGNDDVPLDERRSPAFALGHDQHLYGYYPNKHMSFKSDSVYTAQLEV